MSTALSILEKLNTYTGISILPYSSILLLCAILIKLLINKDSQQKTQEFVSAHTSKKWYILLRDIHHKIFGDENVKYEIIFLASISAAANLIIFVEFYNFSEERITPYITIFESLYY